MIYKKMVEKINTAGAWFTGVFLGEFVKCYPRYCDDVTERNRFIQYIHNEYGENIDYSYDTTKTKCYAVMAIIEGHCVLDAIEHIIQSNDKKVSEDARTNAIALLDAVIADQIILP